MASSSVAFEKFSKWKYDKTPLKVTEIVDGKTAVSVAAIIALDPAVSQVGISNRLVMHSFDKILTELQTRREPSEQ